MATVEIHGIRFRNVHPETKCRGRHCIVHNPIHTHMDDWPVVYREDIGVFERIDKYGCGHPDPSQFDHWERIGMGDLAIHGCTMDEWGLMACDSSPAAKRARSKNGVPAVGHSSPSSRKRRA